MNGRTTLYDRYGQALAYLGDDSNIYLFSGEAVAYVNAESVYSFSGAHLGFTDQGRISDHQGRCVFYTDAVECPVVPIRQTQPWADVPRVAPCRNGRAIAPPRPARHLGWSELSGLVFFTAF